MELGLEGTLDAELADQRGTGVSGTIDVLEVGLADRTDVAQCVHREVCVGIPTCLARLDVETRELEAPHGEAGNVLVRHVQPHGHVVEAAPDADRAQQLGYVFGAYQPDPDQAAQLAFEVGDFLGHELELIRGLITRNELAVAVHDQSAGGGDRLGADPVTLGQIGVVVVAHHLQQEQAADQAEGQNDHDAAGHDGALVEELLLPPVILDAYACCHVGSYVRALGPFTRAVVQECCGERPDRRPSGHVQPA